MHNKHSFINDLIACDEQGKLPIIAEIKASTPQYPDLLRQRSVTHIAEQYQMARVACVSVVTGKWFGGSTGLLEQVALATSLPILRKDFIVSCSAIDHSKKLGANAVLLTKKLVTVKTLSKLVDYALSLGITPFVEVDSAEELSELQLDDRAVLAVCNRDIRTKETDNGNVSKSLSLLEQAHLTGAGIIVSASAISNANEAKELIDAGFDGLLIGTAFLQATDLSKSLNQFSKTLRKK
jgi:indole-3-glycerol phosphate synthase